jgi:hypothetical protein
MLQPNTDYYTELSIFDKIAALSHEIDEMIIEKNTQWYSLSGYIYGLVKLGYSEEYLLSRAPVELTLITAKVREIEEAIAEDAERKMSTVNGMNLG